MQRIEFDIQKKDFDLKVRFAKAKENKTFCEIARKLDLSEDVLRKYTTSLEESAKEFEHCKNCSSLNSCKNSVKGSFLLPKKSGNGIVFSYVNCHHKNKEKYKENVELFDVPLKIKNASFADVYRDDRKDIIKKLIEFYNSYLNKEEVKGIYLHGNFGIGKSYLIAALYNDLAKKNVKSVIVHVPELIRSIKESFDTDYSERFYLLKNTPLLLLDDIGAEHLTPWSRDEVLEPILQYRMDQGLPTFFTSNYNIKELEKHFVLGEDKMKAKRIMERINQVALPIELVSGNLRK